jgi:hypothetical protein
LSRNKDRLSGAHKPQHAEAPTQFNPLNFVAPTEFVELPSEGKWYPESHPLHGEDTIEIKYMTAKDEDILTSHTLLKKGIAIDRLLENVIVDKRIDSNDLLVGDKNAIIIALRASGYGALYDAHVNCTACGTKNYLQFDLSNPTYVGRDTPEGIPFERTERGTIMTKMPFSKFNLEFRFSLGSDENEMSKRFVNNEKDDNLMTEQYKRIILSIEGHEEQSVIDQFVDNMPIIDSRHLKLLIKNLTPNVQVRQTLNCRECSHSEEVDVPFGTDFFWPDF